MLKTRFWSDFKSDFCFKGGDLKYLIIICFKIGAANQEYFISHLAEWGKPSVNKNYFFLFDNYSSMLFSNCYSKYVFRDIKNYFSPGWLLDLLSNTFLWEEILDNTFSWLLITYLITHWNNLLVIQSPHRGQCFYYYENSEKNNYGIIKHWFISESRKLTNCKNKVFYKWGAET